MPLAVFEALRRSWPLRRGGASTPYAALPCRPRTPSHGGDPDAARWGIEFATGRHRWTAAVATMLGLPADSAPTPFLRARILKDGQRQIDLALAAHAGDRRAFDLEFEALHADGLPRVLRARARQDLALDGRALQVLMEVRDVTDRYARRDLPDRGSHADPLTGLACRATIMGTLDRAMLAAKSAGDPLSLVLFAVDGFAELERREGPPVGRTVLRRVAEMARARLRGGDVLTRVGDAEFLWVMPRVDLIEMRLAAECLRWTVEAGTIAAPFPAVTISAGGVTMQRHDTSLALIARADAALTEACRGGANSVRQAA